MAGAAASVAELILAAGEGRRIGGPKALLHTGRGPLVARLADIVRQAGIEAIYVVVGAESDLVAEAVRAARALPVANPQWRNGQTSSLKAGVRALPTAIRGFLIHPVDHAFTTPEDFRALLAAFANHPRPDHAIIRPVHAGRDFGHPVLFGRALAPEFLALDDDEPGHLVYRRHHHEVVLVAVDNPLIAQDLDTPDDLKLLAGVDDGADRGPAGPGR